MDPTSTPETGRAWVVPGTGSAAPAPTLAPPPPPAARPRWTPPPPRGLLPLRPIAFGALLGAPFRLQRRTPTSTLAPALLLSLLTTLSVEALRWLLTADVTRALESAYYDAYARLESLRGALDGVAGYLPLVLGLAASAALAGILAVPLSRALLAERVSPRGLGWRLRGRRLRLTAWALVVLAVTGLLLALGSVGPLLVAPSDPFAGGVLAWLLGTTLAVVLGVPLSLLAAKLSFVAPVLALEGLKLGPAIARSWRLTRGSLARLWGTFLLVGAVVAIATFLLTQPLGLLLQLGAGLVFPNGGSEADYAAYDAVTRILTTGATVVVGALGLVLQAGTAALLYLDQRMRVEGLDHELARYVDGRQRGAAVADPFAVAPPVAPAGSAS